MDDNSSVLGLPLDIDLSDGNTFITPYAAVVVLKGIDSDGDDVYIVSNTTGMTPVEATGLLKFAEVNYSERMRQSFYAAAESSSQE